MLGNIVTYKRDKYTRLTDKGIKKRKALFFSNTACKPRWKRVLSGRFIIYHLHNFVKNDKKKH